MKEANSQVGYDLLIATVLLAGEVIVLLCLMYALKRLLRRLKVPLQDSLPLVEIDKPRWDEWKSPQDSAEGRREEETYHERCIYFTIIQDPDPETPHTLPSNTNININSENDSGTLKPAL